MHAPLLSDYGNASPTSPNAVSPSIDNPFLELETADAVRAALAAVGLRGRPRAGGSGGSGGGSFFSRGSVPAPSIKSTTKDGTLESLDYSFFSSPVVLSALRPADEWMWRLRAMKRWGLFFLVAILTALFATCVIFATKRLNALKFATVSALIARESAGELWAGTALVASAAISTAYALVAGLIVVNVEPLSGGSGLPELKAYLNGVNLPRLLRFKTLAAKVAALPFTLGSGLPVGYEGPMAHVGAATAAMVSQGKHWCGRFAFTLPSATFRLDASKREFVCVGAAAGVAAAFNAPAGAVVFVLEEMGALAWGGPLLWRTFISAVAAAYVIDFVLSGLSGGVWGRLTAQGMFSFGLPPASDASEAAWAVYEIPLFLALGVVGGLAGALFNALSVRLTRLRLAYVAPRRALRVVEVALVTLVVAALSFFLSQRLGTCVDMPKAASGGEETPSRFFCPAGKFSDLASLWFVPPEEAIRLLFHLEKGSFSPVALIAFWGVYLSLMCLTAGIAVPTGHFLPSMLAGCALGRFVGEVGAQMFPGALASPGSYAVIGAACMLGGIMHLSLSMTVILLESTGNAFYSLPLMVTLLSARAVSSLFGAGLYDSQVAARKWPLLEERLPKPLAFSLRACDVMSSPVRALREVERVSTVIGALRGSSHNGFPVVFGVAQTAAARAAGLTSAAVAAAAARRGGFPPGSAASRQPGTLAGYIQRRHLAVLLAARAFHKEPPGGAAAAAEPPPPPPSQLAVSAVPGLPRVPSASSLRRARGSSGEAVRLRVPSVTERHVLVEDLVADGAFASASTPHTGSLNSPPGAGEGGGGGAASRPVPPPIRAALQHHREFFYDDEPLVEAKAFTDTYPRFPNVLALDFSPEEHGMFVDLRPYMDATPLSVHTHAPLERAYKLFVQMGLRHLVVTDDAHNAVGMITRRDLVAERCYEVLTAMRAADAAE